MDEQAAHRANARRAVHRAFSDPVCVRCPHCRWFARRFYGVAPGGIATPVDGRQRSVMDPDTGERRMRVACRRCDAQYEFPKARLVELLNAGRRDLTLGVDL